MQINPSAEFLYNPGQSKQTVDKTTHHDRLTRIFEESRKLIARLGGIEQVISPTPEVPAEATPGPYGIDSLTNEIDRNLSFANQSAQRIADFLGAK